MTPLRCENLRFPSSDTKHTIAGLVYSRQDVPVRAVLQLSHGMCEYVRRYEPMAKFYAAHGIVLAGNDHLGHGQSAKPGEYGHYGMPGGRFYLLQDLHTMNTRLHEKFPGVPIFLYGHSMGSFYARWYAERWPDTIRGLILSGTAGPRMLNVVGQGVATVLAALEGPQTVSHFMVRANMGGYCKQIPDAKSPNAWLTRDEAVVRAYDADPLCTFPFTVGSYREMLAAINHVNRRKWAQALDKHLPVLLISGGADPVGDYGAGVRKVWTMLGDAGVEDLTCQIFEDARHELHNEQNREEVFDYVLTWLEDHLA